MAGTLSVCKEFLIEAISQHDELKSSQISLQKQLIETQEELVKSKTEQLQWEMNWRLSWSQWGATVGQLEREYCQMVQSLRRIE